MTDTTPRAGAPLLGAAQAQKHITHNEALYQLDALLCARFLDRDLSAPPSSPADGDAYLVKSTATGAWTGQDSKIAYCADGSWRFYAPFAGLVAYVADETALVVFDGSAWVDYGSLIAIQNVPLLGINTSADSTNKLSVQSNAALFSDVPTSSGGSGDIRVALSKQAPSNAATLLFQDNFSGRAEIGLTGDDDFHVKVSPDGSAWFEALKLSRGSGVVLLSTGQLRFPSLQNASIDVNTLDDYAEGTFTPSLFGSAVTGAGTYTTRSGSFTKIGNKVIFAINLVWTAHTGSGTMNISGLPFTSNSDVVAVSNFNSGISLNTGNLLQLFILASSSSLSIRQVPSGGGSSTTVAISSSGTIYASGVYTAQ